MLTPRIDDLTLVSRVVGSSEGPTHLYRKSPTWWWIWGISCWKSVNGGTSVCGWKSFRLRGTIIDRLTLEGVLRKISVSLKYWESSVRWKSHIDKNSEVWAFYKWENPHTYHLRVLGEYMVCLSQDVLLIKKDLV